MSKYHDDGSNLFYDDDFMAGQIEAEDEDEDEDEGDYCNDCGEVLEDCTCDEVDDDDDE